jgi:nitrate reductase delta subunit
VLEFAASETELGLALLQEHRAALELLRLALVEEASPYAGAVAAVCGLLPGPSPEDVAAARALARTGPPTEEVGLDGYGFDAGPTSLLPTGARR